MTLLRSLLFNVGRRLAADPRVRAKAQEAFETEIKPRAQKFAAEAKPRYRAARDDIRRMAAEAPRDETPARLAGRAARRVWDELRGRKP